MELESYLRRPHHSRHSFVHSTSLKYSISWKYGLHFFLFVQNSLDFFMKFWSCDPSFNRNISTPLYLKFQTSEHAQIEITCYYLQISWQDRNLKVTLGKTLINDVVPWIYQLGPMTFCKDVFRSVNCTLPFYYISSLRAYAVPEILRSYTPERISRKIHLITFMMSFKEHIYQGLSSM